MRVETGCGNVLPLVESFTEYLATMECLTSAEAKRKWRKAIKDAFDNKCVYCGRPPIDRNTLTIDHIRARSSGGANITSNCLPCCLECNQSKGNEPVVEWYRRQSFWEQVREDFVLRWMEGGGTYSLADAYALNRD